MQSLKRVGARYGLVALVVAGVFAAACGGEVTQSSGGDGGAGNDPTTTTATNGSGGATTTGTTGTTGPGSTIASTAASTSATTGGGGSGMLPPCEQACTDLYNCGLENNNCPGFANLPPAAFIEPCIPQCEALPALISLIDPNNCTSTIQTLSAASPEFAMQCNGGP